MLIDGEDEGAPDVPEDGGEEGTVGDLEVPETPGPDAGGEGEPADVLLSFSEQDWNKHLVEEQVKAGKPYALTQKELDDLPIEAKRALSALSYRGDLAKAQLDQTIAQAEKAREDALAAEQRALKAQGEALQWAQAPGLTAFLESLKPKGDQPDPGTPEGIVWQVKQSMAEQMSGFFGAIKADDEAAKTAARTVEEKSKRDATIREITAYMEQYPDDFADDSATYKAIGELYKKANGALTVQQCHKAVMAQALEDEMTKTHSEEVKLARSRVHKGGTRGKVIPEMPKNIRGNTEAEIEWYDQHPDALSRDVERMARTGGQ